MPPNRNASKWSYRKRHRPKRIEPQKTTPPMDQTAISALVATAQASLQPSCRQYWVFWKTVGKLMQWQAWIWSCTVDRLLSACRFAFGWDDVGFSCSSTVAKWNLSLSLSHEYHHPDSLQLTNRKDGSKNHNWESIEEAYYLVEVMVFVSVFPRRHFGSNDDVIWWHHMILSKRFKKHK
jgi:hypothetical protein